MIAWPTFRLFGRKTNEINITETDLRTRWVVMKRFVMGETKVEGRKGWTAGDRKNALDRCTLDQTRNKKEILLVLEGEGLRRSKGRPGNILGLPSVLSVTNTLFYLICDLHRSRFCLLCDKGLRYGDDSCENFISHKSSRISSMCMYVWLSRTLSFQLFSW